MLRWLNTRRLGVNPRVIKAKMSKWPLKRAVHRNTPQPQAPPAETITITGPSRTEYKKRRPAGSLKDRTQSPGA